MCELCRQYPCDHRCPNYTPPETDKKCELCREYICVGEEYVENYMGQYAHLDCLGCDYNSIEFLGEKVKTMENN